MAETYNYFKITTSSEDDRIKLVELLKNNIFLPESNSNTEIVLPDINNTVKHNGQPATGTIELLDNRHRVGYINICIGGNIINNRVYQFDGNKYE